MMKNRRRILCECLIKEGVEVIFGFPGGVLLPLYDTLPKYPELRHILVRHEQGAAHAADAYARVTGKIGVCLGYIRARCNQPCHGIAICLPGDSVPGVWLSPDRLNLLYRQDAFQEIRYHRRSRSRLRNYNQFVLDTGDIASAVREAIHVAQPVDPARSTGYTQGCIPEQDGVHFPRKRYRPAGL